MFISHNHLGQIERAVERRNVTHEEHPSRGCVEVVVDGPRQRFARNDDLGIAPVAYFEHDGFRAWQNLAARELHNSQRARGKNIARKRSVRLCSGDRNKISL